VAVRLADAANWNPITITSSDASAVAGTAASGAKAGKYTVEVTQLAQAQALSSGSFASSSTVVGTGQLTLELGTTAGSSFTPRSGALPTLITITPANQTIGNKTSLQYTAIETFSDGSTKDQTTAVTWASSNTSIATLSNAAGSNGLANAIAVGSVTVSATDGSVVGTTPLTVGPATLQSIRVIGRTPAIPIPAGYKIQYTAEGTYSDASTQDITTSVDWSSLGDEVATVSNAAGSKGVVSTVAAGSTFIVASLNGLTGNASVVVSNATLSSIEVTPTNPTIAGRATLQFTATGRFSDNSLFPITNQVTWASSSTNAVSIDANTGLATGGTLPGNATISATRGGVVGQTTATHTPF